MTNIRKIEATKLWSEDAGNIIQRMKISATGGSGALRARAGNKAVKRGDRVVSTGMATKIIKLFNGSLKGGAIGGSRLHRGIGYKILKGLCP
ncbi:hypothetical protein X943_000722 [Babesia divergens]|uniref:Uncharacterized protein n=1 Tax=Babesia divergens TaxID=32595 RepID=A0AAD9G5B3_BABDI|nr:hypothetical protein X943_000722 [Babesia divergens]